PLGRGPLDKTTIHRILTSRVYVGQYEWRGRLFTGTHEPLVSAELWHLVQDALADRQAHRRRRTRHQFAYSGLLECGHCGCVVGGQVQKRRYVYYHCSGYRGACPEPYVREEVLTERFAQLLDGLALQPEVLGWLVEELLAGEAEAEQVRT